jgi:vacuolar protein sorting-associated protein 29
LQFQKLLTPGKIGQILCLGNLTDRETYEFLRQVAPDLQMVKGDYDVDSPNLPLSKIVTHGSLRIGFTHGHTIIPPGDADALLIAARQMDVDILLWGGTHRFEAFEMEGRFFINPGSATGAMSSGFWPEGEEPTPSFCLMDVSWPFPVEGLFCLQVLTQTNCNRFKAMSSCCTSISSRPMPMELRTYPLRRSPSARITPRPRD